MTRTVAVALAVLAACGACKGKEAPAPRPPAAAAPARAPAPEAGRGTIRGKVTFTGKAPEPEALKTTADPYCAGFAHKDEAVVVNADGTLRNVVVRLVDAPRQAGAIDLPPLRLDQTTCVYRPHVSAVREGQKLLVVNSDKTLHNVHTYLDDKTLFNRAQPPIAGAPAIEWVARSERAGMLVAKCDVHPWMRAYVAVTPHPWFAVTGEDGTFELREVPAGNWRIEAWHERYGAQAREVKAVKDAVAEVGFTFARTRD